MLLIQLDSGVKEKFLILDCSPTLIHKVCTQAKEQVLSELLQKSFSLTPLTSGTAVISEGKETRQLLEECFENEDASCERAQSQQQDG